MRTLNHHLANAANPQAQCPGRDFSAKVLKHRASKQAVALAVIERILKPKQIDALFVSDGSSTSWIWSDYLDYFLLNRPNDRLSVHTNNLDVSLACSLGRMTEQKWLSGSRRSSLSPARSTAARGAAARTSTTSISTWSRTSRQAGSNGWKKKGTRTVILVGGRW